MRTQITLSKILIGFAALLLVVSTAMLSSCEKADDYSNASSNLNDDQARKPVTKNVFNIPFFVEGPTQKWWANLVANDELYERRLHNQVLGPDAHPVTWGEFSRVTGTARMNCTGQGTHLNIRLSGLIPNGVYTLWTMKFDAPGFDTSYTNVSGFGSVGPNDGSSNSFTASSSGDANFHTTVPAGSLSSFGTIGGCMAVDEYEVHIVGIYHMDKTAHGTTPGPAGSYVEQFAFLFLNH